MFGLSGCGGWIEFSRNSGWVYSPDWEAGVLAAAEPYWFLVPWSWPTRLMCPIIQVHPNGVFLESGSPLLDSGVILPGVVIALATFVGLTMLTAFWFARREVR